MSAIANPFPARPRPSTKRKPSTKDRLWATRRFQAWLRNHAYTNRLSDRECVIDFYESCRLWGNRPKGYVTHFNITNCVPLKDRNDIPF